ARLADLAEAGLVVGRGRGAVAGDLQHHRARVELVNGVPVEPPLSQRVDPEVGDDHVGPADQIVCDLLTLLAAQVQRHRSLVAGGHLPPQVDPVLGRTLVSPRVAALRVLDVDHLCAEVGHQRARERTGDYVRKLDDLHAGESGQGSHRFDSLFFQWEIDVTV